MTASPWSATLAGMPDQPHDEEIGPFQFVILGLFGAMSGVVASVLLGSDRKEDNELLTEIRALRVEVARLAEAERSGAGRRAGSRDRPDVTSPS
ncbi:MAG: hypothetical protein Q7S40_07675 [Opitutaceae bacterium]|nr:hypothetical protein [Opitutaceae bacterium]